MEKQLNKTEVIAFISNTPDGVDWKRVVLTTVENVGKLKVVLPYYMTPIDLVVVLG